MTRPAAPSPSLTRPATPLRVALTVDFEPDCPPYLSSTFRGIEQGAPRLLELFAATGVHATYFTTSEVADRKSTRLNSSHVRLSRMPSSA